MKIAVIGSGIAGLSVAVRLRLLGHEVVVLEKNETYGGKISEIKKQGFTWDGGPSFFTDPAELERLFSDAHKNISDYFSYIELDEACRYFYADKVVRGYDTPEKLAIELEKAFKEPKEHTLSFLKDAKTTYENTGVAYLDHPFSLRRILTPSLLLAFLRTPKGPIVRTMHSNHQAYFDSQKTVQFFDRFATYNGSDPSQAPGLLSCISHLEHNVGAVQPKGGMRSIVTAVARLGLDLGVVIRCNTKVDRLLLEDSRVKGVMIAGVRHKFDAVVNATDVSQVMKWHQKKAYNRHISREQSASALVLYLGVKKTKLPLYLHNILFSDDYDEETRTLWKEKKPYKDPTVYINMTSYYETSHAPKGHQNWFVMANVPAGMSEADIAVVRENMLKKVERVLRVDLKTIVVSESSSLTPTFIEERFGAHKGSIYGLASNSWLGAFFRPPNRDKRIKNLYHCGVTTHPGGGIPLALRSARIVAELVGK